MLPLSTILSLSNLRIYLFSLTNLSTSTQHQPLDWADPLSICQSAKSVSWLYLGTRNERWAL